MKDSPKLSKEELFNRLPQKGEITWIGLRPKAKAPLKSVEEAQVSVEEGLVGDHYHNTRDKKRQVTLIQAEHLAAVASMLGKEEVQASQTRRNIVVKGINLLAFKDRHFLLGEVELEMTGFCYPCSQMENNLGPGGYNAMRGHGGITARVIQGGILRVGDAVQLKALIKS